MGTEDSHATETTENEPEVRNAERLKFFTDAVVAIAMTLLILPLLESIAEASNEHHTPHEWLSEHGGQLFSFALSFAIIASFWRSHHELFEGVRGFTGGLMWLNLAWMLGIVWLPVPTAIVGAANMPTDVTVVLLYIGTMLATSLLLLAMTLLVRRHPELAEPGVPRREHGVSVAAATSILFTVSLVIALVIVATFEGAGGKAYYALFVLFLTAPLENLLYKRLERRKTPSPSPTKS